MYKILIKTCSASNNIWNFYQEDGVDYVAASLEDMKPTALTLLKKYGKKNIKIIDQMSGQDMDNADVYIYDSTDNYEELNNRPYINGIEIVGQLTLEDLGIQPAGDYATEEYVDNSIANIDIPEVDLTNYATIQYVDNTTDTKQPLLTAGENITIDENNVISVNGVVGENESFFVKIFDKEHYPHINRLFTNLNGITDADVCEYFTEIQNKMLNLAKNVTWDTTGSVLLHFPATGVSMLLHYFYGTGDFIGFGRDRSSGKLKQYTLKCDRTIDSETNEITVIKVRLEASILKTDTPTNNEEVANKKYVDDSLNNILIPNVPMDIRQIHTSESVGGYVYGSGISILDECKDVIDSIINEQLNNPVIYLSFDNQGVGKNKTYLMFPTDSSPYFPNTNTNAVYKFNTYNHDYNTGGSETGLFLYVVTLEIYGSWKDGIFTTTRATVSATGKYNVYTINQSKNNFLAKTNTTEFIPTSDYHPATKKYVDDAVANIDAPDVDLSDYYNKTEVDDKLLTVDVNVEGLDIYSDEERVIGRWVDGRPLYQKYIYIGELTNGITDTHLDDYGIKAHEVRFHQVYKMGPDGILCLISPQFMSMAGKVIVRVLLYQEESGFNVLRVATGEGMDVEGHTAYAIVTYTKPDDEILLPTSDYYPATKKYVDDKILDAIPQKSEMPEASADYLDKIYQYIGEDTEEFTKGFFYQCVSETAEDSTVTYSWSELNLNKSGNNKDTLYSVPIYPIVTPYTFKFQGGSDIVELNEQYYENMSKALTETMGAGNQPPIFILQSTSTTWNAIKTMVFTCKDYTVPTGGEDIIRYYSNVLPPDNAIYTDEIFVLTIQYIKTDNNITVTYAHIQSLGYRRFLRMDNEYQYTPAADYHPATKKYVDDAIAGVSGGSGEVNLTNYYTKAEVDALLQALRDEFVSANNNINDKLETIIYGGE